MTCSSAMMAEQLGRRLPRLKGLSVLALANSASDPKMYVAGTLKGVYRSNDSGDHWTLISPPGSAEIHEVESIAIDPKDPKTIYRRNMASSVEDDGRWRNMD